MDSITFQPGSAFLSSNSTQLPWSAVFEDEGAAGYFYACDRSRETQEEAILDAMLIYNGSALGDRTRERIAAIQWSADGLQAVLYLDGAAQAMADFRVGESFCRLDFPNFLDNQSDPWRKDTHAWNETKLEQFEAALYR